MRAASGAALLLTSAILGAGEARAEKAAPVIAAARLNEGGERAGQGAGKGTDAKAGEAAVLGPLLLTDVTQRVSERFPLILAALQEHEAALGELRAARGAFDPTLRASGTVALGGYPNQRADVVIEQPTPIWGASVFAGYRLGLGQVPSYDEKLLTNRGGEVRAGLRVPLLRDGAIDRRRAAIERAEHGVAIARLGIEQQKIEILRLAEQGYWDWVAAGRRSAVAQAWLALATSRDEDLAARVRGGDVPEVERAENERSILQRKALVAAAARALIEAENDLSLFLRDEAGAPITPPRDRMPASLPDPPSDGPLRPRGDEATALARRPEIGRLDAQAAQARVDLELLRNQRLPAVDVLVSGSSDLGPGDASRAKPVFEATVLLDVPLPGRGPLGRAEVAGANVARIEAQARLARDRVAVEVHRAAAAVEAARERAALAKRELSLAQALAQAELDRFRLGESTLLLVNLREQASAEAALRHVDALADYHKAAAAYRAATGWR
jgi:cobalt-zinc-cadmium efflux system outer membrane protein